MSEPALKAADTQPWFGEDPGNGSAAPEGMNALDVRAFVTLMVLLAMVSAPLVLLMEAPLYYIVLAPICLIAAVMIVVLLILPIAMSRRVRFPLPFPIKRFDQDEAPLPASLRGFFAVCHREFKRLGFEFVDAIVLTDVPKNVRTLLGIYGNRATNEGAVSRVMIIRGGPKLLRTTYVEFGTRFSDGFRVRTNNSVDMDTHWLGEFEHVTQAADVERVDELCQLHRFACEKFRPRSSTVNLLDTEYRGDALAFARSVMLEQYLDGQVTAGNFVRDDREYRLTPKGALLLGWLNWLPVLLVRRRLDRRRAHQLIREATAVGALQRATSHSGSDS